jgi:hypothetical protein
MAAEQIMGPSAETLFLNAFNNLIADSALGPLLPSGSDRAAALESYGRLWADCVAIAQYLSECSRIFEQLATVTTNDVAVVSDLSLQPESWPADPKA